MLLPHSVNYLGQYDASIISEQVFLKWSGLCHFSCVFGAVVSVATLINKPNCPSGGDDSQAVLPTRSMHDAPIVA